MRCGFALDMKRTDASCTHFWIRINVTASGVDGLCNVIWHRCTSFCRQYDVPLFVDNTMHLFLSGIRWGLKRWGLKR